MVLTQSISEDQEAGRNNSIQGYEKLPKVPLFDVGIDLYKVNKTCVGLQPLGIFAQKNYLPVRTSTAENIDEPVLDPAEICDTKPHRLNSTEMYYTFGRYCNQSGYNEVPGLAVRGSDWYDVSGVVKPSEETGIKLSAANMNKISSSFIGGYHNVPKNLGDDLTPEEKDGQMSRDFLITKQTEYNGQTIDEPAGLYPIR